MGLVVSIGFVVFVNSAVSVVVDVVGVAAVWFIVLINCAVSILVVLCRTLEVVGAVVTFIVLVNRFIPIVVIADVEGGEETVAEIEDDGGNAIFVETDVTDPDDTQAMVDTVVEEYGRLDYAFNNAGIGGDQAPTTDYPAEKWQNIIDVNLVGVFNCVQAELNQMQEQDSGGVIVNNSSVLGKVGFETSSGYVAAKHGVLGLTKTAALENGATGVRVNAVCPGFIETPLLTEGGLTSDPEMLEQIESRHAMNRLGTPEEVVNAVIWLCDDDASFITGEALGVEGGYLSQ